MDFGGSGNLTVAGMVRIAVFLGGYLETGNYRALQTTSEADRRSI
jgi:hypothetical protein